MKTKCLIVDDEMPARKLMGSYLSKLDDFEIAAEFSNAVDAFMFLQNNKVDLMLLDIQMANMSGLELVKALHQPPHTILTTAFREYATDGFDLNVLDYLVKPISFERFMKAIGKFHQQGQRALAEPALIETFSTAYFFLKVDKQQVKVHLRDICYIESIKDYLKVVLTNTSYIIYHRISNMEEKLPVEHFVRVHKSFIVSLDKVLSCRNDAVNIGGVEIPIGRMYKEKFREAFFRKKH